MSYGFLLQGLQAGRKLREEVGGKYGLQAFYSDFRRIYIRQNGNI
jgi:hypothetical protein